MLIKHDLSAFKAAGFELSKLILRFFKFKLIAALVKAVSHNCIQLTTQLTYCW